MVESHIDLCEITNIGLDTRELIVSAKACPALSLYGILICGISYADHTFQFVRIAPDMTQLLVCFGGGGEALIDGEWVPCGEGTAYLTPPNVLHAYHSSRGKVQSDEGDDPAWMVCWIKYDANRLHSLSQRSDRPELFAVDGSDLRRSIESLYYESMGAAEPAVMQSWASLVHAYAQRAIAPPSRLGKLWATVGRDLAHPWTLTDLADMVALSPEHLRRLCREEAGCSPMRYVTELRMREAAALLASDFYTVDAVASRVGYDNPFAFSTAFKRHTGHPPSSYRRGSR